MKSGSFRGMLWAAAALASVAAAPAAQAVVSGEQAAAVCRTCHTFNKGQTNGVGPNLYGLFGRAAGSAPGFSYSSAMKASGLHWNEATLNAFLAAPSKVVPGTRMPISVADPAQRAALIQYLKVETAK